MPIVKGTPEDAKVVQLSCPSTAGSISGPGMRETSRSAPDKIELIVGYADFTTVLHDAFHVFRGDAPRKQVWPIVARGMLQ